MDFFEERIFIHETGLGTFLSFAFSKKKASRTVFIYGNATIVAESFNDSVDCEGKIWKHWIDVCILTPKYDVFFNRETIVVFLIVRLLKLSLDLVGYV